VIFDFGDTLVDSLPEKKGFFWEYEKFLRKQKLHYSLDEIKLAHSFAEQNYKKLDSREKQLTDFYFEEQFFLGLGVKKNKILAKLLNKAYVDYRVKMNKLMPGTKHTLASLKKRGVLLNVITNTNDDTNKVLAKKYGIYKYFNFFLMSHEEGTIKSELKIFRLLLKKINKGRKSKIQPKECLMVGNNLNEDTVASQMGMKTVILTKRIQCDKKSVYYEPDFYIGNLKELLKIVGCD